MTIARQVRCLLMNWPVKPCAVGQTINHPWLAMVYTTYKSGDLGNGLKLFYTHYRESCLCAYYLHACTSKLAHIRSMQSYRDVSKLLFGHVCRFESLISWPYWLRQLLAFIVIGNRSHASRSRKFIEIRHRFWMNIESLALHRPQSRCRRSLGAYCSVSFPMKRRGVIRIFPDFSLIRR